ncbi:hypothetical protein KI387_021555, partial [Taxus chinensis]
SIWSALNTAGYGLHYCGFLLCQSIFVWTLAVHAKNPILFFSLIATVWAWACAFALCIAVEITAAGAYEFSVGGSKGWDVPPASDKESYNQWAGSNRFQIGDTLCKLLAFLQMKVY